MSATSTVNESTEYICENRKRGAGCQDGESTPTCWEGGVLLSRYKTVTRI